MELALFVYLAGVANSVSMLFSLIGVSGLLVACVASLFIYSEEPKGKIKNWWFISALSCCFISSVIPSEKTMYMIAGAYAAQTVATSPVASKTLELIESKIDSELNNLKKKEK